MVSVRSLYNKEVTRYPPNPRVIITGIHQYHLPVATKSQK